MFTWINQSKPWASVLPSSFSTPLIFLSSNPSNCIGSSNISKLPGISLSSLLTSISNIPTILFYFSFFVDSNMNFRWFSRYALWFFVPWRSLWMCIHYSKCPYSGCEKPIQIRENFYLHWLPSLNPLAKSSTKESRKINKKARNALEKKS